MTLLFWGIVLGTTAYVVCRWREAGRKIDDAQRTLSPEYEAARRRHPSSRKPMGLDDWGQEPPVVLFGRQTYDPPLTDDDRARLDRIKAAVMDAAARLDKEEQA